jgi:hypothetical protein
MPAFRQRLHPLLVVVITACGGGGDTGTGPPPPSIPKLTPSSVQLQSDAGDWVGQGRSYAYDQTNTRFTVSSTSNRLTMRLEGDEQWRAEFQTPGTSSQIQVGTYTGLTRAAFSGSTGGMDWSGEGRGCNTITASMTVDTVRYSAGALAAIHFRFEQHCEGGGPALRGTVHWDAADLTVPPGPAPIPTGLWQPPANVQATPGNWTYLQSDAGDYIGGGFTTLYTSPSSPTSVSSSSGLASVSVGGWFGDFKSMSSLTQLQTGYYGGLQRYPFNNPVKGGLDWTGNGKGCNKLAGWFTVDRVTYTGTTITALDVRFEQHCDGAGPALRGAVHFVR